MTEDEAVAEYRRKLEDAKTAEELDQVQADEKARREELQARAESEPRDERGEFISRAELEDILRERDQQHSERLARARAGIPQAMVPAHGGGPGIDQHQTSWSLAEQEVARRGETLDHWEVDD